MFSIRLLFSNSESVCICRLENRRLIYKTHLCGDKAQDSRDVLSVNLYRRVSHIWPADAKKTQTT